MEGMKQLVSLWFLFTRAHMFLLDDPAPDYEVCYDKVGCFSTDDPFTSLKYPIVLLPQSPDTIRTTYILYTRESRPEPQTLDARYPENILNVWTNFAPRPTKFIVHGFFHTFRTWSWITEMAEELVKYGDYNVIVVDWSGGNQFPYTQATANTRIVGVQISLLINHLIKTGYLTADDFHVIGHSLGVHLAGYAGERITGLGRITGLDPAGLYFEDADIQVRLDETDAKFVDVIHTFIAHGLRFVGTSTTLSGHADYFPNGGYDQPGCEDSPISEITENGLIKAVLDFGSCSHNRAVEFFNASINSPCPFLAFPCANDDSFQANLCQSCGDVGCSHMGFHADKYKPPQGKKVVYYLKTGSVAPFCLYRYTVIIKFSTGSWPSVSGQASVAISGDGLQPSWVSLTGAKTTTFAPGQTSTFYVDLPQKVANVTAVSFKWQESFLLSTLIRVPSLSVEGITVYSQETGKRFQFCGQGRSLKSGSSVTLSETC